MRTRIDHILLTPGAVGEKHIPFVTDAELHIDGNRIVYAGTREGAPPFEADTHIDGKGCLAMPGLINMHTHTSMTLMRSVGTGLRLHDWLHQAIYPLEAHYDYEITRAGADLGVMEMLRYGTTCFCDMYMNMDAVLDSVCDSGMRATLSYCSIDLDGTCSDFPPAIDFVEKCRARACERVRPAVAPHAENSTTPKLMREIVAYSRREGVPVHVHVSETKADVDGCMKRHGMTPPAYLESMGVLDCDVIAAHCVWVTDEDIQIFKRHGTTLVHNPVSNLKLASGIAPVAKMLDAGCRVTLGTDGVASNDNLNLWEEIKLMPLLQSGTALDPTLIAPAQVLACATINAAKGLGYDDLGLLLPGYLADLILVDVSGPSMTPHNDLETSLIYAANGGDVRMTMADGRVLYQDGRYLTLRPERVLSRAREAIASLRERAKAKAGNQAQK